MEAPYLVEGLTLVAEVDTRASPGPRLVVLAILRRRSSGPVAAG